MAGKLKITDIARQTGLSVSTVSRVLAGKSNTSPRAKALVLECAREQGVFEAAAIAHPLVNRIVVFAPPRALDQHADVFYFRIIQGLREAVAPFEIHLSFCALEENDADAPLFLKRMSDPVNEAAIILGIDDNAIHELAADLGKPAVLINCRDTSMRLNAVMPDHRQVGEFGANHLIRQGHRRILVVMCLRRFTLEWRLDGIRDACGAHNVTLDESQQLITTTGFGTAEAEAAMRAYLDTCPPAQRPTAVIAGGDFMAVGIIKALQEKGCHVPKDVSVMSIDGFNLATIGDIALTSVHVAREELGAEALALLQRRIARPHAPACLMLIGGKLAAGASVKRLASRRGASASADDIGSLYG
ncbi:MAG: LacI family DNA-binding transcriptional regulator [Rhodocyclaceae bacterium]